MRILIADDHDVVRAGLRKILLERSGWEICGEAKNGREAVALAATLNPDVVVMDISMPEIDGVEAARQIRRTNPKAEILVLSLHISDQVAMEMMRAGVRGYVLKSDAGRELVDAVGTVAAHRPYFTAKVSKMMADVLVATPVRDDRRVRDRGRLTKRQKEIVQLLAGGKSSKEVAAILNISVKTAETHRSNIMRKLEFHSVSELVRYAIQNELVQT
jgi:DNA-binding NarL/FixJ family response regulator